MRIPSLKRALTTMIGIVVLLVAGGLIGVRFGDATTAGTSMPPLNVAEQNLDAGHNIAVHEQGTVPVTGTVNVGNNPAVQDVNVTNASLPVTGSVSVSNFPAATTGVTKFFHREFFPFDNNEVVHVDISKFKKVRFSILVNGSGTVDVVWGTDGGFLDDFSVDSGTSHSELLGDVAGTDLEIDLGDPDGEQVFIDVFGSN